MPAIGNHLGIDPGAHGGLAIISPEGIVQAFPMPETEQAIADLFEQRIVPAGIAHCMIEQIQHVPKGSGFFSNTKLNRNVGILIGLLLAHKIPFEEIPPQVWQKALGIPQRIRPPKTRKPIMNYPRPESESQWKERLRKTAQKLFPELKVTLEIADALLIAEVCRRIKTGFRGRAIA